jgi:hypothetical protein
MRMLIAAVAVGAMNSRAIYRSFQWFIGILQ